MFDYLKNLSPDEKIQIAYQIKLFCERWGKWSEDAQVPFKKKIFSEIIKSKRLKVFSFIGEERKKIISLVYNWLNDEVLHSSRSPQNILKAKEALQSWRTLNIREGLINEKTNLDEEISKVVNETQQKLSISKLTDLPRELPKKGIRVFLISTLTTMIEGLQIILETDGYIKVVGMSNAEKLPENLLINSDVVLFHLPYNDVESVEVITQLLAINPELRIIMLINHTDFENQTRAIQLGAVSVVKTTVKMEVLTKVIKQAFNGEIQINQELLADWLNSRQQKRGSSKSYHSQILSSMTGREMEIMTLMGEGLKINEIAKKLLITEATLRNHLGSIYVKLLRAEEENPVLKSF